MLTFLIIVKQSRNVRFFIGFVNAQYRFVMNPMGDYTVHFADPDMLVLDLSSASVIHLSITSASSSGKISSRL